MTHVDCFGTIGDLPRAQKRDRKFIMRKLHKAGRYSIFDATADPDIAATMDAICNNKQFVETDNSCGFPWIEFKLTDAGYKFAFGHSKEE